MRFRKLVLTPYYVNIYLHMQSDIDVSCELDLICRPAAGAKIVVQVLRA